MRKNILCVLVLCIFAYTTFVQIFYSQTNNLLKNDLACEVVHVCIVCLIDSCDRLEFYTLLKSIFFYRTHPLHFHVLVDNFTKKYVEVLFDTWSVPDAFLNTYSGKNIPEKFSQIEALPKILPEFISKVIVVEPNIFITGDIYNLWKGFQDDQTVGLAKLGDVSVILANVKKIHKPFLFKFDQNDPELLIKVSSKVEWSRIGTTEELKAISSVMDGLPPRLLKCGGVFPPVYISDTGRPQCRSYPEHKGYKRRTLLYTLNFTYTPKKDDVTLLTHLSYSKIEIFEDICTRWNGPISAAIYVAEDEVEKCMTFIKESPILSNRTDIGFHMIFKVGRFYPINAVRNVALRNVLTDYVLLTDVDFLPKENLQDDLIAYLKTMPTMEKKALIVPAFSSYNPKDVIPRTVNEWQQQWDNKTIFQFKHKVFQQGHSPTNYAKLRKAEEPYTVKWKPRFEPYIVVRSNVTKYDERYFAYGQNKIAHIFTLAAQKYEFIVLPNTFLIHKFHKNSVDASFFLRKDYKFCLFTLIFEHTKEINNKYGTNFKFEDNI